MGASNWKECPNCDAKKANHEISLREALAEAYGKDSQESYEIKKTSLAEYEARTLDASLREDYEFYFDGERMELNVDYNCSCQHCGFSFSHNQVVLVPSAPDEKGQI